MLLIHPPIAKPGEPPAGIARLAGFLRANGVSCRLLDASLEGLLWLLEEPDRGEDTWTRRAISSRADHLAALRKPATYRSPDRYRRAVSDLNRLLNLAGRSRGAIAGLADYQERQRSPVRSADLIQAAEQPETSLFYPWFSRRLPELLDGVTTAGFSLNYLSQALPTFAMLGYLKKEFPRLKIALGGGLVTSWLQRPDWRNPFAGLADLLVAGPGEGPLLALAGKSATEPSPALPDFSGLPLTNYLSPGLVLPFSAASGCYWNRCSFCPERAEGNPYRPIPSGSVLDSLQTLVANTDPVLIHLLDNAVSPSLLQGLCSMPPGVPWYGFARIDRNLADPEFCHNLRRSGCVMLKLGLESGDQDVLDRLQKGINLNQTAKVLDNLHRAGIATYCYLLFGTPAETEEAARRTLDFVVSHHQAITFLNLAIFNMPIYSPDARDCETRAFYDGDLSLYTAFRHPHGWERQKVRRFLNGEFTRQPAIAAILRNDPPIFTSNHATFFC